MVYTHGRTTATGTAFILATDSTTAENKTAHDQGNPGTKKDREEVKIMVITNDHEKSWIRRMWLNVVSQPGAPGHMNLKNLDDYQRRKKGSV
jgi:hypothetical protein